MSRHDLGGNLPSQKAPPSQGGGSVTSTFQGEKDLEGLELFRTSPVSSPRYETDGEGLGSKQLCLLA